MSEHPEREEQLAYSESMAKMLDERARRQKAAKIVAVVRHALGVETLSGLRAVDVGCSAGFIADELALAGATTSGVNIDEPGLEKARARFGERVDFRLARGEDLPFEDNAFDAAMAVLTIHHWTDKKRGVAEMRRVTRNRIVFLTYDPSFRDLWLFDYFPKLAALDEGKMPPIEDFESWLGPVTVSPVLVPYNCTDGFVAAYWRRPAAYLDEKVRAAMSPFWAMGDISEELGRLKSDLESGTWDARYGGLVGLDALDCGYRIIESVLQS